MYQLTAAVIGPLMLLMLAGPAGAQSSAGPATVATLTVLAPPVDHLMAGARDRQPAGDCVNLVEATPSSRVAVVSR